MNSHGDVAVIGGGISGIATAYYLSGSGFRVDLYERDSRLGGRIGIGDFYGRELCFGGKNIGRKYLETRRFLECFGEPEYEEFGINTSKADGMKTHRFDSKSPLGMAKTLMNNISFRDAGRISLMAMRHLASRRLGDADAAFYGALAENHGHPTLEGFFQHRTVRGLLRAATVRMNGAEPDEVYLQTFGSNLQMLMDQYDQVSGGLSGILDAFTETLNVYCNTEVTGIRTDCNAVQLGLRGKRTTDSAAYSHVVIALTANQASQLLRPSKPQIASHLAQVRYFPVAVILAEYDQPVFTPGQRAMLFPSDCAVSNAGAYGINDLNLVRYTLSGRAARLVANQRPQEWLEAGERQLRKAGLLHSHQRARWKSWVASPGLCAYAPRHREFLATLRQHESFNPGLHFVGDYIRGASIENCFRSAKAVTGSIRQH